MKNTNRLFFALLAAAALLFAAGCSGESDDSSSSLSSSSLIGTWSGTDHYTMMDGTTGDEYTITYTFYTDNTFICLEDSYEIKGTWSLSGSTLTLTMSDSSYSIDYICSVSYSENTIILTHTAGTVTINGETTNIPDDELNDPLTLTRVS